MSDMKLVTLICLVTFGGLCDGLECSKNCLRCNDVNGSCETCIHGYWGDNCTQECDANCFICNKTDKNCRYCSLGYWGSDCETGCVDNCDLCEIDTGTCIQCAAGFWGRNCDQNCSSNCTECDMLNGGCFVCNETDGNCIVECDAGECNSLGCQSDVFNEICDNSCNVLNYCVDFVCDDAGARCDSCTNNRWGRLCNETCPEHCVICDQIQGCTKCEQGYHRNSPSPNITCTACSDTCFGSSCNKTTGECLFGCILGYSNTFCTDLCDPNCLNGCLQDGSCRGCEIGNWGMFCSNKCADECDQAFGCDQHFGLCTRCRPGKFGDLCDQDCNEKCVSGECDKVSGACLACDRGYWGEQCNTTCSEGCLSNLCELDTGKCSLSCATGYMGFFCNETCPINCVRGCDQHTGYCRYCADGYYGDTCSLECSASCGTKHCEINTGYCYGCANGTWGNRCEHVCVNRCQICSQREGLCISCGCDCCDVTSGECIACSEQQTSTSLPLINKEADRGLSLDYKSVLVAAGVSAVIAITVSLGILCFLIKRRKQGRPMSTFEPTSSGENTPSTEVKEENPKDTQRPNYDYCSISIRGGASVKNTKSEQINTEAPEYVNTAVTKNYPDERSTSTVGTNGGRAYEDLHYENDIPTYYTQIIA